MSGAGRLSRWIAKVGGAAILLQVGSCTLNDAYANQVLLPEVTSVFSDAIFFFLDSALVHLTT